MMTVWVEKDDGLQGDECAIAEAFTTHVQSMMENESVPRRNAPESPSISAVDACTLLQPTELEHAFREATFYRTETPGLANWDCDWQLVQAYSPGAIRIELVRAAPISASDGEQTELAAASRR